MNRKLVVVIVFFLVALTQLFIPAKMIWDKENVLETGVAFKFKTAPVDPFDPFRGKYITLNYKENTISVPSVQEWLSGDQVFVILTTDNLGYAKIRSISKTKPIEDAHYIKAKVRSVIGKGSGTLTIDYPFDRYYMEETKAKDAEETYRASQQDTSKTTYALVSIKNGEAVLKDVMVNGVSIKDIVEANQKEVRE